MLPENKNKKNLQGQHGKNREIGFVPSKIQQHIDPTCKTKAHHQSHQENKSFINAESEELISCVKIIHGDKKRNN